MTGTREPTARQETLNSTQGWLIVELGTCVPTMIWGTIFTFTVCADRFATIFNLTQLQTSLIFSITIVVFLTTGGLFGMLAAKFSLRPALATVGVGPIVAIVLLQIVNPYPGVVVVFSLLDITGGTAFTITIPLMPQ